jgi:hypothetical protein
MEMKNDHACFCGTAIEEEERRRRGSQPGHDIA